MLTKEYRLVFAEVNGRELQSKNKTNFPLSPSPKAIFSSEGSEKPLGFQLNAHACEINHVVNGDSISNDVSKQPAHTNLANHDVSNQNINVVSAKPADTSKQPQPITSNFVQTTNDNLLLENQNHILLPINQNITSTTDDNPTNIDLTDTVEDVITSSGIEKIYLQEETIATIFPDRRSPSPFPTYELLAPRASVSSDLLDDPISVKELDEIYLSADQHKDYHHDAVLDLIAKSGLIDNSHPFYLEEEVEYRRSLSPVGFASVDAYLNRRHRSASPCVRPLEEHSLREQKRSKSSSDLSDVVYYVPVPSYRIVIEDYWENPSPQYEQFLEKTEEENVPQRFVSVEEVFNEDFKNSLDGVKTKTTNEDRKRQFRRKRNSKRRNDQNLSCDEIWSSGSQETYSSETFGIASTEETISPPSSLSSPDVISEEILFISSNENAASTTPPSTAFNTETENIASGKETVIELSKPGPSKEEKKPDPFWVN